MLPKIFFEKPNETTSTMTMMKRFFCHRGTSSSVRGSGVPVFFFRDVCLLSGPTYAGTQVHKALDGPSREEVMTKFLRLKKWVKSSKKWMISNIVVVFKPYLPYQYLSNGMFRHHVI